MGLREPNEVPLHQDEWISIVRNRIGLHITAQRWKMCEAAIKRAMARSMAATPAQYRVMLERHGAALDALVDELTTGETYFFRDPKQFALLRDEIIPELVKRKGKRPVLAWSAGCASGEEPYSLAMLLDEMALGNRWRILGSDVSRTRLDVARRGVYGRWSLRGVAEERISRHFRPVGRLFEVVPAIRDAVEFSYLNLAREIPAGAAIRGADLIVCRNVLIYLDAETTKNVTQHLMACLAPDGWLLLGPTDPPIAEIVPCDVIVTDAGLAYRRRVSHTATRALGPLTNLQPEKLADTGAASAVDTNPVGTMHPNRETEAEPHPPDFAPRPITVREYARGWEEHPLLVEARRHDTQREYAMVAEFAQRYLDAAGDDPEGWLLLVRSLANLGETANAAVACTAALERHPAVPELAVLQSVLLTALGRYAEAVTAARRALYLDRDVVMAHLALGGALAETGHIASARRAFRAALQLLESTPPEVLIPASDGQPAARLAQLARSRLSLLSGVRNP